MSTLKLHGYPYIRLVIPWMAGVFCGDYAFGHSIALWQELLLLGVFTTLTFVFYLVNRYSLRWCFGAIVSILFFLGGWGAMTYQLQASEFSFPKEEIVYRALITDPPLAKEKTYLCRVIVEEFYHSSSVHKVNKKAVLYLQKDSLAAARLRRGSELLVSTTISSPSSGNNFDEFNYARYLMRQGISGTGYVPAGKWAISSSLSSRSSSLYTVVRNVAMDCREQVATLYRKLGFDGDEFAVLSALTIGEKADLSEDIRDSYSKAGASHVLALSGLHIGLIYALLFFLLKPFVTKFKWGKYLSFIFLFILLVAFAIFTGLSSSVVRSVCMFSVFICGSLIGKKSFSLNSLAATAWVMLLFKPVWLFDVGFQLSFVAVLSILLIQQPIYDLFPVKRKWAKYVWGLMSVSISAQLATTPLVLYYFSSFSTYFLLTNIVIIPLVTLVLYTAVVMLILTPLPAVQLLVAHCLVYCLTLLNNFVRWIDQLPFSSLSSGWLYRSEVLGIYIVLFFLFYYIKHQNLNRLRIFLVSLLVLGVYHGVVRWQDHPLPSLVFYNVKGCPAVHCLSEDRHSWVNYADSSSGSRRLQVVAANYWKRLQLSPPTEITYDYEDTSFYRRDQLIFYRGASVCMVTDNRWRNKMAVNPLCINYLYLCRGYTGRLQELTRIFSTSYVLLDSSLSDYRRASLKKECEKLGIPFISLPEKGSVQFLL